MLTLPAGAISYRWCVQVVLSTQLTQGFAMFHMPSLCRLRWEVHRAAANVLRLHIAALSALATALLLIRLVSLRFLPQLYSQSQICNDSKKAKPGLQDSYQEQMQCLHCVAGKLQWIWLVGCSAIWALTASWLWPQLALQIGWMSHRRPTLPSVIGCAFLVLLAEGLLEAIELAFSSLGMVMSLLRRSICHLLGRPHSASCDGLHLPIKPTAVSGRYTCSSFSLQPTAQI